MHLNVKTAQESIRKQLAPYSDSASLDAQVLLAFILDKPRPWVMAHPEHNLDAAHIDKLGQVLGCLENGEPLPYILGHWEFYGLDFVVSPAVLIPRPETELLVEHAINWLKNNPEKRRAADIGTGSGCIAIALAAHIPDLKVSAVDISFAALQVARQNIDIHQLADRVYPVQLDLLTGISPPPDQRFDLICANLPYIPQGALASLDRLRWEPETALSGGSSGTELIQRMLNDVPQVIMPGGLLLIEIEAALGTAVCNLVRRALPGADVRVYPDLAGHDRLVIAQA